MTGATGFLGAHMTARLLLDGDEPITVLVGHDPATTVDRLATAVSSTGETVPREHVAARVKPLLIRLDAPNLGLAPPVWREITNEAKQIWHCAAFTDAFGDRVRLHTANVVGTHRVLALAEAARGHVPFFHLSTAYVAGGRRHGTVFEDELTEEAGFLTPYEESKYRAERVVRDWAARHGRPVTIFRPSLLVTDRPWQAGAPRHWQAVLAEHACLVGRLGHRALKALGFGGHGGGSPAYLLPGHPDARANLVQAPWAARAMLSAASGPRPEGAPRTLHVTNPREFPVQDLVRAALGDHTPFKIRLGAEPTDGEVALPTQLVGLFARHLAPHLNTTRSYDTTHLRNAVGCLPPP
ncbi:SDR family oxidoreductase, partial [Streptomyces sp. URMC 126]|uniref:SDR family oxidoreductase n=1 Tax=Streptomyces sp. URMC 126 TaxID=3423401 RepID=UPI003F1B0C53